MVVAEQDVRVVECAREPILQSHQWNVEEAEMAVEVAPPRLRDFHGCPSALCCSIPRFLFVLDLRESERLRRLIS